MILDFKFTTKLLEKIQNQPSLQYVNLCRHTYKHEWYQSETSSN